MGHIKDQWQPAADILHGGETEHIDHQIIVTQAGPSLAEHQPMVATLAKLIDNIEHLTGAQKLGFFNVNSNARLRHSTHQIGLSRQKRR